MRAAIWHNAAVKGSGKARADVFKEQWLSKAGYLDGEGAVVVQLHDELPFLLALKKEFAPIPLLESRAQDGRLEV
jgi:hypothetical protein